MNRSLTEGSITKTMLLFSVPMIVGDLLQQFYNIADTFIVGRFVGSSALAAVGSAYALMIFLTSIIIMVIFLIKIIILKLDYIEFKILYWI